MPALVDWQIRDLVERHGMITDFVPHQVREHVLEDGSKVPVISYGCGPGGYDARLGHRFKIPRAGRILDPKNIDDSFYVEFEHHGPLLIPPGATVLARTIETWRMPRNVRATVTGKSTYARVDLLVNVTPMEHAWQGSLTVELANLGKNDVMVYPGEGILQVLFEQTETPEVAYDQRPGGGKYQGQEGVTIARV